MQTSAGISTSTGPGRPERKAWKARRITWPVCCGRMIASARFTTVSQVLAATVFGRTKNMSSGLPPGSARIGTLSALAWARPPTAFSAPAWDCTATTPKRLRSESLE